MDKYSNLPRINLAAESVDVTDSKIIKARISNQELRDCSWYKISIAAHVEAYDYLSRQGCEHSTILAQLTGISRHSVIPGECEHGSFAYCPQIRASIQKRSACQSLEIIKQLALAIGCDFELTVRLASGVGRCAGKVVILEWSPELVAAENNRLLSG